ncbi:CpaD family pilus assembly lipoprotein [Croceicoccus sp. F390]|uniref:CpaD family pilus assembly lipoprotein n=1 Tax=Croceicoccus esteveae TaxID=3075597 RepID=A0ABU2ZGH3_9SPHN|nr:CpaD family pilus assembly lipoprotein [Croceicoccus sp. F390]MDT0575693.1 CpaD family pilus assembly lipoprotein [Croceicoccus sp. F390]
MSPSHIAGSLRNSLGNGGRQAGAGFAIMLLAALSGCIGGVATNRSLYSQKQPVVESTRHIFTVSGATTLLPVQEQARLNAWLSSFMIGDGDSVTILSGGAGLLARRDLAGIIEAHGLLPTMISSFAAEPLPPGVAQIVLTRARAFVPGCPDWSAKSDANPANATHPGYGCAVNSNVAAMIANPHDLLRGQAEVGNTVAKTASKAIDSYRQQPPSGINGLAELPRQQDR